MIKQKDKEEFLKIIEKKPDLADLSGYEVTFNDHAKFIFNLVEKIKKLTYKSKELLNKVYDKFEKEGDKNGMEVLKTHPYLQTFIEKFQKEAGGDWYKTKHAKELLLDVRKAFKLAEQARDNSYAYNDVFATGKHDDLTVLFKLLLVLFNHIIENKGEIQISEETALDTVLKNIEYITARLSNYFGAKDNTILERIIGEIQELQTEEQEKIGLKFFKFHNFYQAADQKQITNLLMEAIGYLNPGNKERFVKQQILGYDMSKKIEMLKIDLNSIAKIIKNIEQKNKEKFFQTIVNDMKKNDLDLFSKILEEKKKKV